MRIDGLSREEIIEKYKPIIMLTLDREGLEELSKTDERVMEYKKRLDELHADENFMAYMRINEENKELWSIIEKKEMNIRKIKYDIARKLKQENIDDSVIARVISIKEEDLFFIL